MRPRRRAAAWSGAFFGLRSTLLGLVVVVPSFVAVGATTAPFARTDRRAAALNDRFWALN